jgi:hypothetical protein
MAYQLRRGRPHTGRMSSLHDVIRSLLRRPAQRRDDGLIYRLKRWPNLPYGHKTADVMRTLSVMSNRPVNRHWILSTSKLRPAEVDRLLRRLKADDALEVIDSRKFAAIAAKANVV